MKLHLSLLEKLIELPSKNVQEIRHLLDDLGLEVKGIEGNDQTGEGVVYTIETLANRGDHLSAFGIAREVSARLLTPVKLPGFSHSLSDRRTSLPIVVQTTKCLRYAALEVNLLSEIKLRPEITHVVKDADPLRHPIVHVLNFILLELGQPMHAFDRDKVEGEVVIAELEHEEEVEALDGKSYKVPPGAVVIRDKKRVIAVGGVIGCANSMVTGDTKRVLIESATFDPVSVRKTARAMGISTDASYTFERGADVDNVLLGLKRALFLLGGASTGEGAHCTGFTYSEGKPTEKRKVPFSIATLKKQLTLPRLQEAEVVARLKNLGFICEVIPSEKPSEKDHRYSVTVPSWRLFDVRNEEDLIEEFARVHGLNKVKMELPPLDPETPVENEIETVLKRVEGVLHGAGFVEVITKSMYSQVEVDLLEKLSPGTKEKHVSLKNALERNNSHLRITNVISLARLAETNHRKGVLSCKMYEVTRLFSLGLEGGEGYEYERDVLSLAVSGRWNLHEWRQEEEVSQIIFKVKGVLEGVFKALGVNVTVSQGDKDILHPGIQGTLSVGRTKVGFFGVIHPEIKDAVECSHPCIYAEIDLRAASKVSQEREFASPSEFPSVRRDLTFKVSERELAGRVVKFISEMKLDNFVSAIITDDFKRESEEFRRVTYRITFNSKERTLAHGEVDLAVQEILTRLKDEHRIELAQ